MYKTIQSKTLTDDEHMHTNCPFKQSVRSGTVACVWPSEPRMCALKDTRIGKRRVHVSEYTDRMCVRGHSRGVFGQFKTTYTPQGRPRDFAEFRRSNGTCKTTIIVFGRSSPRRPNSLVCVWASIFTRTCATPNVNYCRRIFYFYPKIAPGRCVTIAIRK